MKNKVMVVSFVLAMAANPAHAQFSKLLGKTPAASTASGSNNASAPTGDSLVDGYQGVSGHVVNAQASLAEALGLKDQVVLLQAEQKSLAAGQTDTSAMKKTRSLTGDTSKLILAKMDAQPTLEGQSKAKVLVGIVEYVKAAVAAKKLVNTAQQWSSAGVSSLSGLAGKGKAAMWVAKETPGLAKDVASTTRALLAFAKSNKIEVPSDATAALSGL